MGEGETKYGRRESDWTISNINSNTSTTIPSYVFLLFFKRITLECFFLHTFGRSSSDRLTTRESFPLKRDCPTHDDVQGAILSHVSTHEGSRTAVMRKSTAETVEFQKEIFDNAISQAICAICWGSSRDPSHLHTIWLHKT